MGAEGADEPFRIRVDIDAMREEVRDASAVALRSLVADTDLVFEEMGRGVGELFAGLDLDSVPEEDARELVNRVARMWVAWWMIAKAGTQIAERQGLDHLDFSQYVDVIVEGWASGEEP